MAQVSAWMPLYIGDYLADTMHLSGPEHGAYLLLIMHYWRTGPLPNDDRALASIARTERKEWVASIGGVVRTFFRLEGGTLHHRRIDAELAKAIQNSCKRRDAANARWKQPPCESNANASIVHSIRNDPRARSPSPSPSPSEEEERTLRVPKKIGRRLPDDWEPGEVGEGFARERGLDISETLGQFRDYWAAAAGRNATKLDWAATWRTWCRNQRRPGRAAPGSDLTQMARAMFGSDLQQETLTYEQLDDR